MSIYFNNNVDWSQLIKLTPNGLEVQPYSVIKQTIVDKFKSIYGDDIDLATSTADGIYLEFYSLMINNILQNFLEFYSEMNINTAVGTYLDILASLKGLKRLPQSKSMAAITISNNGTETITIGNGTKFIDINGESWSYTNGSVIAIANDITLAPNSSVEIIVFSDNYGPIKCNAGTITQSFELQGVYTISQTTNGIEGSYEETDSELRKRCNETYYVNSAYNQSNIEYSLKRILGIKDVRVYNQNSNLSQIEYYTDGTQKYGRTIYVIIRKDNLLAVDDENIGRIIYNACTPGIPTIAASQTVKAGTAKSLTTGVYDEDGNLIQDSEVTVNWKEAKPIKCKIKITITKNTEYVSSTNDVILNSVLEYLNNMSIGQKIDENQLSSAVSYSDPLSYGKRTFLVNSIQYQDVEGEEATYGTTIPVNYNSYYEFTGTWTDSVLELTSGGE